MGSASNISSATAKTSTLSASLLSSVSSSFSIGQMAADGLFADILSQNQPPPVPPPQQQQQNNNSQGSQTSSSQTQQSAVQDASNTQNPTNSGIAGLQNQPVVSPRGTGTGKTSHHHDAKQAGDKNKPDNAEQSAACQQIHRLRFFKPMYALANNQCEVRIRIRIRPARPFRQPLRTTQNDANDNNDPANNNSNTNSDPANPPVLAADLNVVSAAPAPATPAAPQQTDPAAGGER